MYSSELWLQSTIFFSSSPFVILIFLFLILKFIYSHAHNWRYVCEFAGYFKAFQLLPNVHIVSLHLFPSRLSLCQVCLPDQDPHFTWTELMEGELTWTSFLKPRDSLVAWQDGNVLSNGLCSSIAGLCCPHHLGHFRNALYQSLVATDKQDKRC